MTYTTQQLPTPRRMARGKKGRERRGGFALIASLTLMMLLGLIAVGVLSMASTQNRLAAHASMQAQARQQALIGLDAALSEMQMELGPDQRVTASSGILSGSDAHPHILGVWNSWKHALYDTRDGSIKATYEDGRSSHFRRWLISSRNPDELSDIRSARNLGKRDNGQRICLVGEGTLGHSASQDEYIYADLVEMQADTANNTACFAWWVGGENQKAHAAIKSPKPAGSEVEILNRTWDTPAPSFMESPALYFLDALKDEDKDKMLTLDGLGLPGGDTSHKHACFYHVTTCANTLPTNVRDGGLKHDLNMLLSKSDLQNTPYRPLSTQDCPLADPSDALPESTEGMPIGSWQTLHAYHNTWPKTGSGSGGEENFSARLSGSVLNAYARMSGYITEGTVSNPSATDHVSFYDTRSVPKNAQAGYARTPVLLAFLGAHGLAKGYPSTGQGGFSYGLSYAPFVQWWNPYNVPMHVGAKKLWAYSLPYRTTSIFINITSIWARWPMLQPKMSGQTDTSGSAGQRNTFSNDWGNYFVNSETDQKSEIIFAPGEILVFSMGKAWNNLDYQNMDQERKHEQVSYSQPQSVPFCLGDNAGRLHNYFTSLYSMGWHHNETLSLSFETKELYNKALSTGMKTRVDPEIDGQDSNFQYLFDTIGDFIGPHVRNMFAVVHGFDGVDASDKSNLNLDESRKSSRVDRFYGARGISPQLFSMAWYDYDTATADDMKFCGEKEGYTWTESMEIFQPLYFAAVGIVPKSYNPSLNALLPIFRRKDYRTKVWQHSNPALGASAIYQPDDQERQYHPYQLAGIEMGTGLGRSTVDTINNRNGVYGTISAGGGGGESASFISVLELPYHPPFSLAGFAGMRLSPGWYDKDDSQDSIAKMRRMQYRAGVPGVGIGNSFADPCIPADAVYATHSASNLQKLEVSAHKKIFSEFYDHGFLINDALWDRWFCSSIADMPLHGQGERTAEQALQAFFKDNEPLPVSRYKKNLNQQDPEKVLERLKQENAWRYIARYLWIEGGFNINSVSEEAWTATLQGLAKRDLLCNAGGTLKKIAKRNENQVLFSRFMVSTAQQPIDDLGYDPLQGSSSLRPSLGMATAWGEVRSLTPEQIRELARQIVKIVRERGPFLNMADFINRRLDGGTPASLTGALQAAIDATDINNIFKEDAYNVTVQQQGQLYKYRQAAEGSMYTAAPGYLIQSDVLSSLGNILTVRDDTFTVRAYGCVRNTRTKAVLAQAWCEATVQRTIEYVDPSANTPEDSDREDDAGRSPGMKKLSPINRTMGRKLKIVSFRWLDNWDI